MLKNKVILITGASQGIGRAIALKCAEMEAKVCLNDLKKPADVNPELAKAEWFLADVSKLDQVEKMIDEIKDKYGKIDILINNAGICEDKTLAKMSKEQWQKVIDVNLTGVFNCCKTCLPLIIANQGKIINLSSIIGQTGNFGQTNYAASKAGIIGFTKSLSKEVGRFGVTVNAIAPGFIETGLTENIPEEIKIQIKKLTSLQRFGKAEEVADLAAFLASEEASFITGAVINIDGGL